MDLMRDAKKYNNFGIHGSGIASAADALAAVEKYVFDEKSVSPERLITALDTNFENDPELFHMLRYEAPKMGQNNAVVNALAGFIMDELQCIPKNGEMNEVVFENVKFTVLSVEDRRIEKIKVEITPVEETIEEDED